LALTVLSIVRPGATTFTAAVSIRQSRTLPKGSVPLADPLCTASANSLFRRVRVLDDNGPICGIVPMAPNPSSVICTLFRSKAVELETS
jgi:hypothetical protein